jgi:hypothetical protein
MDEDKLLALYPEFDKVLGPYSRPDGRQHIVLYKTGTGSCNKDKRRTISFPKALMEIKLEQHLNRYDTTDHIDRDKQNNDDQNLQVLERSQHAKIDALRVMVQEVICGVCGKSFLPSVNQRNSSEDKAGPFCSKRCTGVYGKHVQISKDTLKRKPIIKTYYQMEK